MRGKLFLLGAFGLGINAFLYFRGGWMPMLLFAAIACIIVGILVPGDDSSSM
jgi:hypothetical protein